jgi:hypothetical protein
MYCADIKAIPDDKWTATFGGCTRPANDITADAMGMLVFCTKHLNDEDPGDYMEAMTALASEITDKDAAIAKFQEVCGAFSAAVAGASDEKLNHVIMTPWQMPTSLYSLSHTAASHIWYHDGQLNYIQCLLGDEKVHWMGE